MSLSSKAHAQLPGANGLGPNVEKKSKVKHWWDDLLLSGSLTTTMGTGSFAPSSYKNHYVAQTVGLFAMYRLPRRAFVSVLWNFDFEFTQPDNPSGRRFLPRDVGLRAGWRDPILPLGKIIHTSLNFRMDLPTSLLAQMETRYLRLGASLAMWKTFGRVTVSYSGGATKSFHRYTSRVLDQGGYQLPSIFVRQGAINGTSLDVGQAPIPGMRNVSWVFSNSLAVQVQILRSLTANVSFSIINLLKYPTANDEFTPRFRTTDGNTQLAKTVGRSDLTASDISFQWTPLRYLTLALGLSSFQPPFTNDNKGLRLPFFNFSTNNNNFTTMYLQLTGRY